MYDAEARNTNFRVLGRLTEEPRVRNNKNGKLMARFTIAWNRNRTAEPAYINFVCMDSDLSLYIKENFHRGDMIHVLSSTPSMEKFQDGRTRLQFAVWNVVAPYKEIDNVKAVDGEGDVPY